MRRYDRLVILRGAAFGLLIGAPAALLNGAAAGDDGAEGTLALSFVGVLVGFLIAGTSAGSNAPAEPARHGALAGLAVLVPVELLVLLGRLDRGAPIRLGSILFLALLAAWVGSLGGLLGARRKAAAASPSSSSPQEGP